MGYEEFKNAAGVLFFMLFAIVVTVLVFYALSFIKFSLLDKNSQNPQDVQKVCARELYAARYCEKHKNYNGCYFAGVRLFQDTKED